MDLADHHRLCPAPPRPAARRGPAPALGTARPARTADPGPGPPRVPEHPRDPALPDQRTETRQTRPRPAARIEEPPPGTPSRRGEKDEKGCLAHGTAQTRRLNNKLRACLETPTAASLSPVVAVSVVWCPSCGSAGPPRHRGFYRQLNMLPRLYRLESTAALKGEGPGDDAGVRGPACGGCGHVDRLIT